jgi:hypothetical protein
MFADLLLFVLVIEEVNSTSSLIFRSFVSILHFYFPFLLTFVFSFFSYFPLSAHNPLSEALLDFSKRKTERNDDKGKICRKNLL